MTHQRLNFVTVATTWHPIRAWLIRNRLAAAQIDAIVTDENLVSMDWLTANAIGGIKIQVPLTQAEAAIDELSGDTRSLLPISISTKPETITCVACRSVDVCDEDYSRRAAFLTWFFVGFPLPFRSQRLRCLECGHRFEEGDETPEATDEELTRPFQFSLMTLMTWVTIAACLCGILRMGLEAAVGKDPVVGKTPR